MGRCPGGPVFYSNTVASPTAHLLLVIQAIVGPIVTVSRTRFPPKHVIQSDSEEPAQAVYLGLISHHRPVVSNTVFFQV